MSRIVYLLIFVTCEATSDVFHDSTWTDMEDQIVQVPEYCKNKTCIVKCCPGARVLAPADHEAEYRCVEPDTHNTPTATSWTSVHVYANNALSGPTKTNKTLSDPDFIFLYNNIFWDTRYKIFTIYWFNLTIFQDGFLDAEEDNASNLEYCLDFYQDATETKLAYRKIDTIDPITKKKEYFNVAGLVTSSAALALVLLVYAALPQLRTLSGAVVMGYLLTQTCFCATKAAQELALLFGRLSSTDCQFTSPVVYFFEISSFFWLNVMSFDLWRTVRDLSTRYNLHGVGESRQLWRYGAYAWGTPALLTAAELLVDQLRLLPPNKPYSVPFRSCFGASEPTILHVLIPIGVMTAANWALFLMTAYNVWRIKRDVTSSTESRNTKNSEYRFAIYVKLCVLMGISWVLEVVPHPCLALYILLNFFNVFIGVAIFIIFVCKKDVFRMLCKRFHIKKRYQQSSQYSRSESSSFHKKSRRQREQDEVGAELTTFTETVDM